MLAKSFCRIRTTASPYRRQTYMYPTACQVLLPNTNNSFSLPPSTYMYPTACQVLCRCTPNTHVDLVSLNLHEPLYHDHPRRPSVVKPARTLVPCNPNTHVDLVSLNLHEPLHHGPLSFFFSFQAQNPCPTPSAALLRETCAKHRHHRYLHPTACLQPIPS